MVVGAKSDVPLDIIAAASLMSLGVDSSYVVASKTTNRTTIETYIMIFRHRRALAICSLSALFRAEHGAPYLSLLPRV